VIIAHRRLILSTPSGETEVPVRLFQPEEDGGAWICRYEIEWPGEKWSRYAAGVASIQALILALQLIGIAIYTSRLSIKVAQVGRELSGEWIPASPNVRGMLAGDDISL
jgi:Domain of unknown function (DUF6968)